MEAEPLKVQPSISTASAYEDESYWQHHTESHRRSGLMKSVYCQRHQVHYHRFIYWSRKRLALKKPEKRAALVKVQLKESLSPLSHSILCTLTLTKGLSLQIHDQQALSFILERLS